MSSTNASLSNIAKNQGSKTLNNSKKAVNKQMKGFKQASPLKKVFIVLVVVMLFLFILYCRTYYLFLILSYLILSYNSLSQLILPYLTLPHLILS